MVENFRKLLAQFILDDGYTSYDSLPAECVDKLVLAKMFESSLDSLHAFCSACDNDVIYNFMSCLMQTKNHSPQKLLDCITHKMREYYHDYFREYFDSMFSDLDAERKREGGLHPIVDRINGETRWVR